MVLFSACAKFWQTKKELRLKIYMGLGFGLKLSKARKNEEFRQFIFVKTIANVFNRWRQNNLPRVEK